MEKERHVSLSKVAGDYMRIDKELTATKNRIEKFEEMGWPNELDIMSQDYIDELENFKDSKGKEIESLMNDTVFSGWVKETKGLGARSIGLATGLLPYHEDMKSVSATWKYLGLHVGSDGNSIQRNGSNNLGFDPSLRAVALHRVGKFTAVMCKDGQYRKCYDQRKEKTQNTHPPMYNGSGLTDSDCEGCQKAEKKTEKKREGKNYERKRKAPSVDCGNVLNNKEGSHWTDGHRHADALRVATKAIFRDWWRVGRGQEPKY